MKIGIIGFGRLGKLAAKNLAQDTDLFIYDPNATKEELEAVGATYATLEQVCSCPMIIPIVPISELENVLRDISALLQDPDIHQGKLIIDVCSVKTLPTQWMERHLPSHLSILGTHPMFGPDSAKKSLYGHKIVLCPVRLEISQLANITGYLESHGLKVIKTSPQEHDQQVASSLLLTHFIGRSLIDFGASKLTIDTKGYRRLMKILETVENDTWQLFVDMNDYNPYAKELRANFIKSLSTIDQRLG